MKKIITVALICAIAASAAFAGGGSQASKGKTTLTFYTWADMGSERAILESVIEDFQAANPDIKVEGNYGGTEYLSKINTMIASNTTPDVFQINEFLAIDWGEKGVAADLNPYYAKAGIKPEEKYINSYLFTSQGKLWAVGACPATILLYYNKNLLRQAGVQEPPASATNPWTWDQFVSAAKKMTKDSGGRTPNDPGFNYNSVVQWGTVMPTAWIFWMSLMYSAGTSVVNDTGTALAVNSPAGIRVLQSIANLSAADKVAPSFAASVSSSFSNLPVMLMNDQLAMFISGTWDHGNFVTEKYDIGLAQIPTFTGKGNNHTWSAGYMMKKNGSDEAFKFFEYMMDFNNWVKSSVKRNIGLPTGVPTTRNTFTDPALNAAWMSKNDPTIARVGGDIVQNAARIGENVTVKNWAEIVEQNLQPAVEKVFMGEETPEQALQGVIPKLAGKFQGVFK